MLRASVFNVIWFGGDGPELFNQPLLTSKLNFGVLRLINFIVVAYIISCVIKFDSKVLRFRALSPIIKCGQHSLSIFCVGVVAASIASSLLLRYGNGTEAQSYVFVGEIGFLICTM